MGDATITADRLQSLVKTKRALDPAQARLFAAVLEEERGRADLATGLRVCHFLAQAAVETGWMHALVESTSYKDPAYLDRTFRNVQGVDHARRLIAEGPQAIGNTIYAGKNGNGGVDSGDGYRFRGRGFLMVTGRANYRTVGQVAGLPLESQPELLGEPHPAAQAAMLFWASRRINIAADADDVRGVTRLVNGGALMALADRTACLAVARQWAPASG